MSGAPLHSMTGFGAAEAVRSGVQVRAELRSVNHKHLQVKLRLPAELARLEPRAEALLKGALQRGAVNLNLSLQRAAGRAAFRVQPDVARAYREQLEALGAELGVSGELDLPTLAQLPGVLAPAEAASEAEGGEEDDAAALEAIQGALDALIAMRAQEGAATLEDLRRSAEAIRAERAAIQERAPLVVREHKDKLAARVAELLAEAGRLDEADLAREVALLADRLDVSEELSRLESHLAQLDGLLGQGGSVGRRLDFLAQEFLREANTIGSKCSDAAIAHRVVELKTWIERLREQVQNVE